MDTIQIHLPDIIGEGYGTFFRSKARYLVCKGGRGSKKSCSASLKIIRNIMKYPGSHALIVRRYNVTHRESTFAQLRWAINRLGVSRAWKANLSPLKLTYLPTGQTILFRGLDDPQSIASITVEKGHLCFVWLEEAYQVMKESDFDKLDLSIRGKVPDYLFKQLILTFNPWNRKHWLKSRFFDKSHPLVHAMTTTYLQNEFLGDDDIALFDLMKAEAPGRYSVEGLGEWGTLEGAIYINYCDDPEQYIITDVNSYLKESNSRIAQIFVGIDWGHGKSANTAVAVGITEGCNEVIILDEFYTTEEMGPETLYKKHIKFLRNIIETYGLPVRVLPDNAEKMLVIGLSNQVKVERLRADVKSCVKFKINERIDLTNTLFEQGRIKIHAKCTNVQDSFQTAVWDDNSQRLDNGTSNIDSLDAFEYAICTQMKNLEQAGRRRVNERGSS